VYIVFRAIVSRPVSPLLGPITLAARSLIRHKRFKKKHPRRKLIETNTGEGAQRVFASPPAPARRFRCRRRSRVLFYSAAVSSASVLSHSLSPVFLRPSLYPCLCLSLSLSVSLCLTLAATRSLTYTLLNSN